MSVFRNYNPNKAGDVNANAFPRVYVLPWEPTQRNIRGNPNIPSQPQRVQPHERGTFYPTSASDGGTLAPSIGSSGGCGCGGADCSGAPKATSQNNSTGHAFPVTATAPKAHIAPMTPRIPPRVVGAIRPIPYGGIRGSRSTMKLAFMGGRLTR